MKAIITSTLGKSTEINGVKCPAPICSENGLLDTIRRCWPENAKVLCIYSSPEEYESNDIRFAELQTSFQLSGLESESFVLCDGRNPEATEDLSQSNVLILTGGHVPTQNAFHQKLHLQEKIKDFKGLLITWSAGSMNLAETVYAAPELEGEAIDPDYQRWIPGLGLIQTNIFPHYKSLRDDYLDGQHQIHDIVRKDSYRHEILILCDGSYIVLENGEETLYGEAYWMRNGNMHVACKENEKCVIRHKKQPSDCTVKIDDGYLNIRVGAIILKGDHFLMAGSEKVDYLYSVGGRIRFGETAEQAVVREVYEETGIIMEVDRLGFILENYFICDIGDKIGQEIYELAFFFYMKVPDDFELASMEFADMLGKEFLTWVPLDSGKEYYPKFLGEELKNPCQYVKHMVVDDRE